MKKLAFLFLVAVVLLMSVSAFADVPEGDTLFSSYTGSEKLTFFDASGSIVSGLSMIQNATLPNRAEDDKGYYISGTTAGALTETSTRAGYAQMGKAPGAIKTYSKITFEFDFYCTTEGSQITVRDQQVNSTGTYYTNTYLRLNVGKDVLTNTWNKVAITYSADGGEGTYKVYLNGKEYDAGTTVNGLYGMKLIKIQPVTIGVCDFGLYLDNLYFYGGDYGYSYDYEEPIIDAGCYGLYGSDIVISDGCRADRLVSELNLKPGCTANVFAKDGSTVTDKIDVDNDYLAISNADGIYSYYTFRTEEIFAKEIDMYAVSSAGVKTNNKFLDGTAYASVDVGTNFCSKDFSLVLAQYDSNGKVVGVNSVSKSVNDKTETLKAELKIKDLEQGKIKAMIWVDGIKPLTVANVMSEKYSLMGFDDVRVYYPGYKLKAATFSVDDGSSADGTTIDILNRYNLKGTFNLITDKFCNSSESVRQSFYNLYQGHEAASHSRHHSAMYVDNPDGMLDGNGVLQPYMSYDDVINELKDSIDDLKSLFGIERVGLAWPRREPSARADYNQIYNQLENIGFEYARGIGYTRNFDLPTDWYKWNCTTKLITFEGKTTEQYAKEFVAYDTNGKLALFAPWGHSTDFSSANDWQIFENACKVIADASDSIWSATNMEICLYVKSADKLQIDKANQTITNNGVVDLYVTVDGTEVIIPANSTVKFK